MTTQTMPLPILDALARRPSRASAAALGDHYILNAAPPAIALLAIDALAAMPCDWAVSALNEAVTDPGRSHRVRKHALEALSKLLHSAIDRGYCGISRTHVHGLIRRAQEAIESIRRRSVARKIPALADVCAHLNRAVAHGFWSQLPDF